MKKVAVLLFALILVCAYAPVFETSALSAPPQQQVSVINTPANPVPITGNVGMIGTSDVRVINMDPLPIEGNVSINGTPSIKVSNNADHIQAWGHCDIDNYHNCTTSRLFTVPDKKRFVLEYFSCNADLSAGQHLTCAVGALSDLDSTVQYLTTSPPASEFPGTVAVGQQMRMYAASGWYLVTYAYSESASGVRRIQFHLSGYLEDVP